MTINILVTLWDVIFCSIKYLKYNFDVFCLFVDCIPTTNVTICLINGLILSHILRNSDAKLMSYSPIVRLFLCNNIITLNNHIIVTPQKYGSLIIFLIGAYSTNWTVQNFFVSLNVYHMVLTSFCITIISHSFVAVFFLLPTEWDTIIYIYIFCCFRPVIAIIKNVLEQNTSVYTIIPLCKYICCNFFSRHVGFLSIFILYSIPYGIKSWGVLSAPNYHTIFIPNSVSHMIKLSSFRILNHS